jgi:uncharacterized protein
MRLDNQRRSTNFEVRRGGGGAGGGGFGGGLPFRVRGLGIGGIIIIGLILLVMPANIRNMIIGQVLGGGGAATQQAGGSVENACPTDGSQFGTDCDQAIAILASTEDTWVRIFREGAIPQYGRSPGEYQMPRLVIFDGEAVDSGCGTASSQVGPFYCPADNQLYINPQFYEVMRARLNAPGDFAQAYVIAHEVGHHVQNLIGATQIRSGGTQNQNSVRLELQADCFAGVWGHSARANLAIDEADLREALNAAHAIGDDTLQRGARGYPDPDSFTHGTSDQRMRWFRRGFESGDARQCDTFAVTNYNQL